MSDKTNTRVKTQNDSYRTRNKANQSYKKRKKEKLIKSERTERQANKRESRVCLSL